MVLMPVYLCIVWTRHIFPTIDYIATQADNIAQAVAKGLKLKTSELLPFNGWDENWMKWYVSA